MTARHRNVQHRRDRSSRMALVAFASFVLMGAAPPAPTDPTAAVRRVIEIENRMYSDFNPDLARLVYAPDILWQNPFGVRLRGESAVEQFLRRLFTRSGFRSAKEVSGARITDIRMIGANAASAWSEEASEGQTYKDGTPVGVRKSHILYLLERRRGQWMITDEMIMDEKNLPAGA